MTEAAVTERLPRKHKWDGALRAKDEMNLLREHHVLGVELDVPDAAAPLEVLVDIKRRSIDVGMTLRAPEDKVSTKARLNWLVRQIKASDLSDLYLRLMWPGKAEPTQYLFSDLKAQPELAEADRGHLAPHSFHVFSSRRLGARFTQQTNFIADIETIIPKFYGDIGAELAAWQRRAPKIKEDRSLAEDVSTKGISENASEYDP